MKTVAYQKLRLSGTYCLDVTCRTITAIMLRMMRRSTSQVCDASRHIDVPQVVSAWLSSKHHMKGIQKAQYLLTSVFEKYVLVDREKSWKTRIVECSLTMCLAED